MNNKSDIRKYIKSKIADLGGVLRSDFSSMIKDNLIKLPEFDEANKVFIYISFDNEVHTKDIIKYALDSKKQVYVPNVQGDIMNIVEIDSYSAYTMNDFGIVEPLSENNYHGNIDVAVIPLIAFDRHMTRLGRGGGYYDKFLKGKNCVKVAVAYSAQEVDKLPREPHDIPFDIIVTEKGVIR